MHELHLILANIGINPTPELIEAIRAAVKADEHAEYEQGMLDAMYCAHCGALYEEDCCCEPDGLDECECCGGFGYHHKQGCIFSDPLSYENCGYG